MAFNINMTNFPVPGAPAALAAAGGGAQQGQNIIETGNVHQVLTYIRTSQANPLQKIEAYLSCLSQTLSMIGPYQQKCESELKNRLFEFVKEHPREAQLVLLNDQFNQASKLSEVLKKVHYLSAGILGFHNGFCNYTRAFFHHFKESYFENKHSGLTAFALGAGFVLVGGIQTALTVDPNPDNTKKRNEGWATTGIGGALIGATALNIFYLASQDEP